jgi:DNA-binding CsgD family transcriptional regulator
MLTYIVCLVFIISVAIAAGGIVLSTRLQKRYRQEIFSTLVYYQVFIYTFGFYGIWGQVIIKAFLSEYISVDVLTRFNDVALLLGLPFVMFAWLMLIQLSNSISGRKRNNMFTLLFILLNVVLLITMGYITGKYDNLKPAVVMKDYFIFMNTFYTIVSSVLILFPERNAVFHAYDRKKIATGILIITVIQSVPLIFFSNQVYIGLLFITVFFLGNVFLPVYLSYGTTLNSLRANDAVDLSFEEFCGKFEVSPREMDIAREICNGLSNKEISDKLFISLQTVKDHTHRIYIKTNVKSRVQLITLVKEMMGN